MPSLPVSATESTALKAPVDPLCTDRPEPAICPDEGVDLNLRELEAPVAQGRESFERSLEKIGAELLVCQNLPDDQLHCSLRHDSYALSRVRLFGAPFSGRSRHGHRKQRSCRRTTREKTAQIRRYGPSRTAWTRLDPRGVRVNMHPAAAYAAMGRGTLIGSHIRRRASDARAEAQMALGVDASAYESAGRRPVHPSSIREKPRPVRHVEL
jgi:hypothetical protein